MKKSNEIIRKEGGHGFGGRGARRSRPHKERRSKKETTFSEVYHGAGGGHGEDVTMSWLLIPLVLGLYPLPTVPSGSMLKGAVLSECNVETNLDGVCYCILRRPLYKPLRCWKAV